MNRARLFLVFAVLIPSIHSVSAEEIKPEAVKKVMKRVADWQIAHFKDPYSGEEKPHHELHWANAALYNGMAKWAAMADDESYYSWLKQIGENNGWKLHERLYHADDHAVGQMYVELYRKYHDERMIGPAKEQFDYILYHPARTQLNWKSPYHQDRWNWCDALFMSPPLWAMLYNETGEEKYLDFMMTEFKATTDFLFDKKEGLYYRDEKYKTMVDHGRKIFWSRGNGWVFAGLVNMMKELEPDSKEYRYFKRIFKKMAGQLLEIQTPEGHWAMSLLNQEFYPTPETSGSSFFIYGLAWGINNGILDKEKYLPSVITGWNAMVGHVTDEGMLGYVQPIGQSPGKAWPDQTEVYGAGAFLSAGSEVYTLFARCKESGADPDPNATFDPGVPVRVGPENFNSTFSYYNTTPESPDGSLISYVKILSAQRERSDDLSGELWVCNTDLSGHIKITELHDFGNHNGVNAQWVSNRTIAYYDDRHVRVVNLKGKELIPAIPAASIGHAPHDSKILYSRISEETGYYTVYEYDMSNREKTVIADVLTFKDIVNHFASADFEEMTEWKILHLMYSPDGSKIALRLDVGPDGESHKHLVTMNKSGGDIRFFGPKPMHFAWYDNTSIMGHDNQVSDGLPDDKSARRWSLDTEFLETLAGPGNHLAASLSREFVASESWYGELPVILKVFINGETNPFWHDTVSEDEITVWELGNHVNPSFSRDGKRVYFNKNTGPRQTQAWMVVLPEIQTD